MNNLIRKNFFETKLTPRVDKKRFYILLYRSYYNTGAELINMLKYFIYLLGGASILSSNGSTKSIILSVIIGIGYIIACFVLGWGWYYFKMREAESEFGNLFNPFVEEMRQSIKK